MHERIPRFSVSQPVLVNLVAIVMLTVGGYTFNQMTRESLPSVPVGMAMVTTLYPGASPSEVEQLVTAPIEQSVESIDGIKEINSTSQEGYSVTVVRFKAEVEDVERKVMSVTNAVAAVKDLPAEAEQPHVREGKTNFPVLAVSVSGAAEERVLRQVAKNLQRKLEQVERVDVVTPLALRGLEIKVEVDPDRLSATRVPLSQVTATLKARANNIPAGSVTAGRSSQLVRAMTQVQSADDVREVVLQPDARGGAITVGDVAQVSDGLGDAEMVAWVNGKPAIVLVVFREDDADGIDLSAAIHEMLAEQEKGLPPGVTIDAFGDTSHEVRRSLSALYNNAAMGLLLVLALMWLFVGLRNAAMAAAGIPVALAGGIVVMHMLGVSINSTSLFALMLCLGIVVDDAIIIIENIYRHMQNGRTRMEAAVVGTREVFWPVVSSTLTTTAAFLPLLLMTGIMGKFFSIIPKVVIAALSASLVEAMFILPSHMADFGGRAKKHLKSEGKKKGKTDALYASALRFSLKRPKLILTLAYLVCASLLYSAFTTKKVVLFHDEDTEMFDVRVRMPIDTTREETDRVMAEVDRRLHALRTEDVQVVSTNRGYTRTDVFPESGDHVGMATVYMKQPGQRSSGTAGNDLVEKASRAFDDLVGPTWLQVVEFRPGPPRAAPVGIRIMGENRDRLAEIAEQVMAELREIEGTRNVSSDFALGKRELRVRVDERRAAMHGLSAPEVGHWLNAAFSTAPVAVTRVGDEEVDIKVHLDEAARQDPERLSLLTLVSPDGSEVALGDIADIERGRGAASLERHDTHRSIMVTSRIDPSRTTSQEVNLALLKRIKPLQAAHPEVRFKVGGEWEQTKESLDSLFEAFGLAALLIFAILASQFRSFILPVVVMAGIPLALIGVAVGFLVSSESVGLIALVGVVGLEGIVVNDSLVLVDFINERRKAGMPLIEAIVEASRLRLRPILLTSVTTIAGLAPLAIGLGGRSPTLAPMAVAMSWGLTFSTVLILILIPCLYLVTDQFRSGSLRLLRPITRRLLPDREQPAGSAAE